MAEIEVDELSKIDQVRNKTESKITINRRVGALAAVVASGLAGEATW